MMQETRYAVTDRSFDTGISQSAISRYVDGERIPSPLNAVKIAEELGVFIDELIDFYEPIE